MEHKFEICDEFYLNEKPMKIISGGMHYFRVVPEYWRDRLEKLKAMGCNTVETYVAWNMHEPKKGMFDFTGLLDLEKFIKLAQELELWVIIRPSPYICGEWEFGGLPAWLLAEDGMRLRGRYQPFLNHVEDYYKKLFQILTPLQINYGGPIIMMQVENEYGYYGDDTEYLVQIKDMMVNYGCVVPLVTSDGPWGDSLACGSLDGVLPTGNFGSNTKEQFPILKKYTKGGPLMCMEYWVGWFDSWGAKEHQTANLEEHITDLDEILKVGSVNIYMFEGGTNFGFMNGSNYYDELTPDVTSYDYDAVLTEAGALTEKYHEFKKVISKYTQIPEVEFTTEIKAIKYGELKVEHKVGLFHSLEDISTPVDTPFTSSMEKLGQNYGYILYRSPLIKETKIEKLRLWEANDRANIFVDQSPLVTLYDRELLGEVPLEKELKDTSTMDILVENMGRVNFGPKLEMQRKGINGGVQINGHQHFNWSQYTLPLDNLCKLDYTKGYEDGQPAFYQFHWEVSEIGDTYLDFDGWGKGCAFVNGFNIGRFWEVGPQKRLYIPGPLLQLGDNEIVLFETEGKANATINLVAEPDLG